MIKPLDSSALAGISPAVQWSFMQGAKNTSKLQVSTLEQDSAIIVELIGDAGVADVDALQIHLIRLSALRPALIVFDLAALNFISSLGLGMLMEFQRGLARHGGQTRYAAPIPAVRDMLRRCKLDAVMKLYDSVEAALNPPHQASV